MKQISKFVLINVLDKTTGALSGLGNTFSIFYSRTGNKLELFGLKSASFPTSYEPNWLEVKEAKSDVIPEIWRCYTPLVDKSILMSHLGS